MCQEIIHIFYCLQIHNSPIQRPRVEGIHLACVKGEDQQILHSIINLVVRASECPEVFEAVVRFLVLTLITKYR